MRSGRHSLSLSLQPSSQPRPSSESTGSEDLTPVGNDHLSSSFFSNPYRGRSSSSDPRERAGSGSGTSSPTSVASSGSIMSDETLLEKVSGYTYPDSSVPSTRRGSEKTLHGSPTVRAGSGMVSRTSMDEKRLPGSGHGDTAGDFKSGSNWESWSGLPLPASTSSTSSPAHGFDLSKFRFSPSKLRLWVDQARLTLRGEASGLGGAGAGHGARGNLAGLVGGRRGVVLVLGLLVLLGLGTFYRRGDASVKAAKRMPYSYGSSPSWYLPKLTQLDSYSPLVRNVTSPPLREIDIASEPLPMEATLTERLLAWERSPGARGAGVHLGLDGKYHEEVELGGFQAWNLESCANIAPQMNTHMVQFAAQVWSSFNRSTLHETRMTLIEHMRGVERAGLLENTGEGRGIVMVAGNADTLQRVIWAVQYMRNKGTTLPVQVYHFPGEEPSAEDGIHKQLRDLNIQLVAAAGQSKDEGKTKSYHLKAIAVVQCPFQEVLYMDSDNIPTRNPEYMFDSPSYRRMGFWATYDYWKTSGNNAIWAILGIRCRDEWEMEAGQMFVDKKRHLDVFLLTQFMLEHHDFFFYFSDGDKDIFRWALLALRKRWGVPGRWVGVAALPGSTASGDHCGHTMLQHDAYGEPLFVHYNLLKQIPSGVGRGFTWGKTKRLPLFNNFPPPANYAHANELAYSDHDLELRGIGDIDSDMLADADDEGHARAPAREEIRRRAARERGIKARYHGGWISALCIDLDYQDPRPEVVRKAEEKAREARERLEAEAAETPDEAEPTSSAPAEQPEEVEAVQPNWGDSPIETVFWRDSDLLRDMEANLYDMGFKPNGPGF